MAVNSDREAELRSMVREQLDYHIERAIGGDEYLMKEVFEKIRDDKEDQIVNDELQKIRDLIGTRGGEEKV